MILEDIVEDLLQNKFVLVVSKTLNYFELQMKLKDIYEDVLLYNLVFCDSVIENIEEEKNKFDSIYYI